jgi:tetratricopeptide (TPR) repeat protein
MPGKRPESRRMTARISLAAAPLARVAGWILLVMIVATAPGCGAKKKEITTLDRNRAANVASEAQFALSLRDFARAEPLLAEAAEICPDTGDYWMMLGQTRMRLNQRDGARSAYRRALDAFKQDADANKTDPQPLLQQVTALALLGRVDEARQLLESLPARFPDNRAVRSHLDNKVFDRMLADSSFKELAL